MKVRMINDETVVTFDIQTGNFGQMTRYIANLSRNEHYYIEDGEKVMLDWEECYKYIVDNFEDFIEDVKSRIVNNRLVAHSYNATNDIPKAEKAEKHLAKNINLLAFLENYNID